MLPMTTIPNISIRRVLIGGAFALAAACGGGDDPAPDEAGLDDAPDTLPPSIEATEVQEGYLVVSPAEVRAWQDGGEAFVLIDARDPVQFGQEHIPGAVNIPYVDVRAGARLPDRDARLVLYCSDASCPISRYAYSAFERLGYPNLYEMHEGIQGWKAAGYPTVIGAQSDEAAPPGEDVQAEG